MSHHPFPALWQFQTVFGQPATVVPGLPIVARRELRKDLLEEEYQEYRDAEEANDLVGIADALIDMIYIAYGTGIEYGLPMDALFDEVHRSNMSKLDPVTGQPIRRADGKILKPASYSPPDLAAIIKNVQLATAALMLEGKEPNEVLAPANYDTKARAESVLNHPEPGEGLAKAAYNPLSIMEDFFLAQKQTSQADEAEKTDPDCTFSRDQFTPSPLPSALEIKRIVMEAIDEVIDEAIADLNEADEGFEETVTIEGPPERFVIYVPVPSGSRAEISRKIVEDFSTDFLSRTPEDEDDAIYYFLPTNGKPKMTRL